MRWVTSAALPANLLQGTQYRNRTEWLSRQASVKDASLMKLSKMLVNRMRRTAPDNLVGRCFSLKSFMHRLEAPQCRATRLSPAHHALADIS